MKIPESMKYRKLFDGKVLYHFCAGKFLPSIRKSGLRLGVIPTGSIENPKFIRGYQWLTTNADFNQSWNEGSSLLYDRNEYRITISLPKVELFNLFKWSEFGQSNPLYDTLSSYGDPENWYVFRGVIIPYWMINIHAKNP